MTSQEKECLLRLEDKLEHIHKEVKNNAEEIKKMKTEKNCIFQQLLQQG